MRMSLVSYTCTLTVVDNITITFGHALCLWLVPPLSVFLVRITITLAARSPAATGSHVMFEQDFGFGFRDLTPGLAY
jgi:hypothetical protein